MSQRQNNFIPFLLSFLSGFGVCLAISMITNRREAWDSEMYFQAGIPMMCVLIFAIAYFFPKRSWLWVIAMAFGQFISMLLKGSSLNLWPLSVIALSILSVPQFVTVSVASKLSQKKRSGPKL